MILLFVHMFNISGNLLVLYFRNEKYRPYDPPTSLYSVQYNKKELRINLIIPIFLKMTENKRKENRKYNKHSQIHNV